MDGTLEQFDGRPALRFERRLPHPLARVWRAVTEPGELAAWFVVPVEWTPAQGERYEAFGQTVEIVELVPEHVIAWTWGGQRFSFELRPDGDGCVLVFRHVFADGALGADHAAGWEAHLLRLDAHLAGGSLSPEETLELVPELHERYALQLGVDPAPGRRAIAGMPVGRLTLEDGPALRFERRYRHPIERLWRAIAEPDERAHWLPSGEPIVVTESRPPRLLAGTWFGDALRFELRDAGDGCVLVFTHAFADRDASARTAAGWERCFARLDARLAGSSMDERESLVLWPAAHERYAEAFGVDPETGRRAFEAHPLT
ncbi:MAG: SRPBCC domain-containing protein [Thermoleophilia bacterium]